MDDFKPMKLSTDVSPEKRLGLIRHLITMGVTSEGLKIMGASDEEIKQVCIFKALDGTTWLSHNCQMSLDKKCQCPHGFWFVEVEN